MSKVEPNLTAAKQIEAMRDSLGDDVFEASLKLAKSRRDDQVKPGDAADGTIVTPDNGSDPSANSDAEKAKAAAARASAQSPTQPPAARSSTPKGTAKA